MYKKIISLFLCILILLGTSGCSNPPLKTDVLLQPEQMKEDLDCLYKAVVDTHPKIEENNFKNEYDKIYKKLYDKIKKPMTVEKFIFIAEEAVMPFHDAHTSIFRMNIGSGIKAIPLKFLWLEGGMIVSDNTDLLKKGDKIISIGNKTPGQILKEMKMVIPAENDMRVKHLSQHFLPYIEYLDKLGLIYKNSVSVKVEHIDGKIQTVKLPLIDATDEWVLNMEPYTYEIKKDNDLAVFHLNACVEDEGYREILNDFFSEVQLNGIDKIAVDLRHNTGGDSRVMDEFLRHIKIDDYTGYADRRVYQICPKVKVYHDDGNLYNGKIYVLTSNATFSSANWFAVTFKYNKIGTIVGEPTGNALNCYGNINSFTLPNSKLYVSISKNNWVSPYMDDSKNTLEPDVYIPLTREDVVSGNDPCINWIIEN